MPDPQLVRNPNLIIFKHKIWFLVAEWKAQKKLNSLGMPLYVASGSHVHKNTRYRFLILQRFDKDLEKILQEKKVFNLKTVLTISSQILNILEYLHHKGYIHSDIKASNILLSSPKKKKTNKLGKSHTHGVYNPLRACRIKKSFRYTRNLRPTPNINYAESQGSFSDMGKFLSYHSHKVCNQN